MIARRTALVFFGVVILLLLACAIFLRTPHQIGKLQTYAGQGRGVEFAGNSGRLGLVSFRYYNGTSEAVAVRVREILKEQERTGEWKRAEVVQDAPIMRIPAHHAATFEFPAPRSEAPWRVTFQESEYRPSP